MGPKEWGNQVQFNVGCCVLWAWLEERCEMLLERRNLRRMGFMGISHWRDQGGKIQFSTPGCPRPRPHLSVSRLHHYSINWSEVLKILAWERQWDRFPRTRKYQRYKTYFYVLKVSALGPSRDDLLCAVFAFKLLRDEALVWTYRTGLRDILFLSWRSSKFVEVRKHPIEILLLLSPPLS